MTAHAFDSHSVTCPVCHRVRAELSGQLLRGLFICHQCQERLVISQSGHFVRDPFRSSQRAMDQMLRRQSHPLMRMWRDAGLNRHPLWWVLMSGGLLLLIAMCFFWPSPNAVPAHFNLFNPTVPLLGSD
ncbi:sigma factor G inhibitor Gin [Trichothermofontia sichuanensis B231]|uniref:sigma factor G inhibitor Gin n=1 Tax=Trichothermofontia sichuanensis TaxID=3045816 RepID=UPI002245683F|nr:sigma factor G inhibitor Gin [Trichothermofontia sichuanensis]UZQ53969.1 sigma factor G inhibitor Gin [Trichothermofontia sichuanensis B231]